MSAGISEHTHTVTITREGTRVASPRAALLTVAVLSIAALPLLAIMHRAAAPARAAAFALVFDAALAVVLAFTHDEEATPLHDDLHRAGLAAMGASTGVLAWFFSPHSGFAAFLALLIVLNAVLADGPTTASRAMTAWVTYLAIAVSQAVCFALIASGAIGDDGIMTTMVPGMPLWQSVFAGHVLLQIVFAVAFLSGLAFHRRYTELVGRANEAIRQAALREALLDEARADYRRALSRGRGERSAAAPARPPVKVIASKDATDPIRERQLPDVPHIARPLPSAGAPPRRAEPSPTPERAAAWSDAYASKMRSFAITITLVCTIGAGILLVIGRNRMPLELALACMAVIVVLAWLHQLVAGQRSAPVAYWMWAVIGVLSVGPAYVIGLHSAFSAIVAAWLFSGGLFHAGGAKHALGNRGLVLAGILIAHSTFFVLIMTGVLPDAGNFPVHQHDTPVWRTAASHVALMGVYASAFFAGVAIDRRYDALAARAEAAIRRAATQQALLDSARADLDRRLEAESRGIFSGTRLGVYQLGPVLGRGGMGDVYAATRVGAPGRLAIKVVRPDQVAKAENLQQFLREMDALKRIRSPHVARVVDAADASSELPFMVMEFIEGTSLGDLLREHERLVPADALAMIRSIGRGLGDVHAAGVLHCDVKPSNIIRTIDRRFAPATSLGSSATGLVEASHWSLIDFGVAELVGRGGVAPRRAGGGTPAYMAPEHALGEPLDRRADLYSLCIVAYRALTGLPPYTGDRAGEIAAAARRLGPPDPRQFVDMPIDVTLALRIGLAAWPGDRFEDATELVAAFEQAFAGKLNATHRRRAMDLIRRQPWAGTTT